MNVTIANFDVYTVENGIEVFSKSQKFRFPALTYAEASNYYSNPYTSNAMNGGYGAYLTQFYIRKAGVNYSSCLSGLDYRFELNPYFNKTVRLKLRNDTENRYIQFTVSDPPLDPNSTSATISNVGYYKNGSLLWDTGDTINVRTSRSTSSNHVDSCYSSGTISWYCTDQPYVVKFSYEGQVWYKTADYDDVDYYNYYGGCTLSRKTTYERYFRSWIDGAPIEYSDLDNPYSDGGVSIEGGGKGNFSEVSDTPETDLLPSIGAVGSGFATIFKPNIPQLKALSDLFWNSNVFTFLQNLVENITNMFTSLAMVPFDVDAGRTVNVTWLGIETSVLLTLAAKQYYEFDMGSINMADDARIFTSGSVLDYSPFSKLGVYLPFIGYQDLDIDECRNAVINLRYRIDILSGACVAILKVDGRDLYQFTGNCLTQIPITNESMQSLVSDAVNVGIAAAGAGAAAANAGSGLAEAAGSKEGIQFGDIAHAHTTVNRAESSLASASANAVIGSKPTFNKSGAISSSASMMALKQPYLFLSTPRQSIPEHYQRYRGFPSNITSKLGDLNGFTVVEDIRLNGLVATSPEVAEIYDLLKKGVII